MGCFLGHVHGGRLRLAGGLVFGEIQLLFDFTLASGQFLVTRLALEGCAHFTFEVFGLLLRVRDVGLEFRRPLFEALDRRLEQVEQRLRTQFTALDTLVARFQSTGDFLARQLDALLY